MWLIAILSFDIPVLTLATLKTIRHAVDADVIFFALFARQENDFICVCWALGVRVFWFRVFWIGIIAPATIFVFIN